MQTREVEVCLRKDGKSQVVDVIPVPVYESLQEARDALTDDKCLKLINRQNQSDITNAKRAEHKPGAIKGAKLFDALYNCLTEEEALGAVGNSTKLRELLASDEIQNRLKAKLAAA